MRSTTNDAPDAPRPDYVPLAVEAARVSCSKQHLENLARRGLLKVFRLGNKRLVKRGALDALLEASVVASA